MKKLFGTDGIRARAGEFPLDAPTIEIIGASLARQLTEKLGRTPRVALPPGALHGRFPGLRRKPRKCPARDHALDLGICLFFFRGPRDCIRSLHGCSSSIVYAVMGHTSLPCHLQTISIARSVPENPKLTKYGPFACWNSPRSVRSRQASSNSALVMPCRPSMCSRW